MTISKRQKMLKLIWVLTPWSLFRILEAKRNPEDEEKTEHKHRKLKRSIYGFELETWRCSFFVCCRMKNYSPATVTSRSSTAHGTTRLLSCCVSFEKVRFSVHRHNGRKGIRWLSDGRWFRRSHMRDGSHRRRCRLRHPYQTH